MPTHEQTAESQELSFDRGGDSTLVIRLGGSWRLRRGLASTSAIEREISAHTRRVVFDTAALGTWDSSLLSFVTRLVEVCRQHDVSADLAGLPPGLRRLVELAETVPEQRDTRRQAAPASPLERLGNASIRYGQSVGDVLGFMGEISIALGHMLRGSARYRRSDLFLTIQECGANALGIVTLISYLVGTILAFMGAVQLQQFGAQIYVADLVGIAMVREMGAMMTGIIMAGRTGAAFAAQLGSMKVR
ncbi:MAG: ABC transporter permease, partial [Candidatus Binataceae bacterium]